MDWMRERERTPELLDDPNVRPEDLAASLTFMRHTNELFGGRRAVLAWLARQDPPSSFTLLDVGSGAGDIPFAIAQWAEKHGRKARVTAIDLQPLCVAYAARNFNSPDVLYLEHSAFEIEKLGGFDYIVSSMFFHHLNDAEIAVLMKKMARLARRGWLVNDLYRGRMHYLGAWILGSLSFRTIVFNDAKLSVKRAFRPADFERFGREAAVPGFRVERRPVYRITMSGHGNDGASR